MSIFFRFKNFIIGIFCFLFRIQGPHTYAYIISSLSFLSCVQAGDRVGELNQVLRAKSRSKDNSCGFLYRVAILPARELRQTACV